MIQQSSNMATTAVFEETNTDFDTSLMEFFYSTTSEDALPDINDTSSTTITEVANEIPSLFSYSNNDLHPELDYESSSWYDITDSLPQNIPDSKSEPIATNPTNVLTSPLQAFADFNHGSSTGLTTKQPELFHHNNNAINGSFKNNDYTTNKINTNTTTTTTKQRISKPYERSPLMKPSVTIASIDTIAKLKTKSKSKCKSSSISKPKVRNPFYKPFISSSISSETALKNTKIIKFRDENNDNSSSFNFTDIDNKLTYDLSTETTNSSFPQTVLEALFKNFDDALIFDSLFDINQI